MISFSYLLNVFIILNINSFFNNVLCGPDSPKIVNKLVDLSLDDIDKSNFSIVDSDRPPEAYKITPLEGKKITFVNINEDVLWVKHENSECESVTIYNTRFDDIIIALNIIEDGTKHVINFAKNKNILKDSGLLYSISMLNKEFLTSAAPKMTLDINCPFDMLYFNFGYRQLKNFELKIYEYGTARFITNVVNKLDKIWEPTDTEKFCKRITVYLRNSIPLITKIIHDNDNISFYREHPNQWNRITIDDFNRIYESLDLNELKNVPDIVEFSEPNLLNLSIIKKNLSFTKQFGRLGDNYIFSIRPYLNGTSENEDAKKTLVFGGQVLLEIEKKLTEITLIKTREGIIFVEIATRKDGLRNRNIYLKKERFAKNWLIIKQNDFYEKIKNNLVNYTNTGEVRYYYAAGEVNGGQIEELPEDLLKKVKNDKDKSKPSLTTVKTPIQLPPNVKPKQGTTQEVKEKLTTEDKDKVDKSGVKGQLLPETSGTANVIKTPTQAQQEQPEPGSGQQPTNPPAEVTGEPSNVSKPVIAGIPESVPEQVGGVFNPEMPEEHIDESTTPSEHSNVEDNSITSDVGSQHSVPEQVPHPDDHVSEPSSNAHSNTVNPEGSPREDGSKTPPKNELELPGDKRPPSVKTGKDEVEVKLSLKKEEDNEEEEEKDEENAKKKKSGFFNNRLNLLFLAMLLISS